MRRKPAKRPKRAESRTDRLRIRPRAVALTIAGSDPSGGAGPSIDQAVNFGIERTLETIHVSTRLGHGIHPAETRGIVNPSI